MYILKGIIAENINPNTMKTRNILVAAIVMFSGLALSACTDESENIIPTPVDTLNAEATVISGEKDDPMD